MKTAYVGGVLAAVFAFGCNSASPELRSSQSHLETPLASVTTTVAGFNQTYSTTKFQTGGGVSNAVSSGYAKWVGVNGVFGVDSANGSAMGVMNASVAFVPYGGGRPAHEVLVRSYFVGAGIPVDQIGSVHTNVGASEDGPEGAPEVAKEFSFSSVLTRAVSGISVAESHAWAQLDVAGNVFAESVYWPALDASVVSDGVALSAIIGNSASAATFLGSLPFPTSVSSTGSVVIHHSSQFVRTGFQSVACYDVWNASSLGSGWVRHFDKSGVEVHLPQELRTGTSSVKL